jgi:hypothetical protein
VSLHGGKSPGPLLTAQVLNSGVAKQHPYHSPAQAQFLENESEFHEAAFECVAEEVIGL